MSGIGFTNNAALCIAKWFTASFGMGLTWEDLDEDSVIASANICDERILVQTATNTAMADAATNKFFPAAGGRYLDWGDGVRVSSSGSLPAGLSAGVTYYAIPSDNGFQLATSVTSAFAGTAIDISTAGTGTLTVALYDEARYKLNGSYTLDAPKGDVLKQLLSAMAGVAVYIGGKWFIHAGAPALPTVTLTANGLRGDMTWVPKRSMRDRFNGVKAVYVNPSANWQPVDAPPLQNADYLAEDGGEELYEDVRYPFTTSTPTVQRLMKIALESNRRQGIVQFPAKLTAMRLQPWDGVYLTMERYGWDQKQFRVIGWTLSDDGGVDLTLQEDDAGIYAWTADEESASAIQQGVVLPDPNVIAAPATVGINPIITPTYSRVEAIWDEVLSIWLDGYDVEHRLQGDVDWSSYGRVGATAARVAPVENVLPTDFRVRSVTKNGSTSAFTTNLAPAAPGSPLATGTDITWINDAGAVSVQVFKNATSDFSASALFTTVTPGSLQTVAVDDDAFYWLRSVNAGGNISDQTATITVGSP